jgi:hypothetical protein
MRDPECSGEVTRYVDGGATPQLAECVVPDDCGLVVKALGTQRLAEAGVVLRVDVAAGEANPVLADGALRRGRQQRRLPSSTWRVRTCPKLGAVRVTNTNGCALTLAGTPLPPRRPAPIRW